MGAARPVALIFAIRKPDANHTPVRPSKTGFLLRTTRNSGCARYIDLMNRRQFTQRLAALFAAPALPARAMAGAVSTASAAAPVAGGVVIPAGASSWADYLMKLHKTCTPDMLRTVLNVNQDMATVLHQEMVSKGMIKDGNRVVSRVKEQLKTTLEAPDLPQPRPATQDDLEALADIWHAGWHEAHAAHVPPELTALRDRESFAVRLGDFLAETCVIGPVGAPTGFCIIKKDEIYQIYTAPSVRGSGVAAALLSEAEKRLAARGVDEAKLHVIPQNARAIAFYTRQGWAGDAVQPVPLDTLAEPFLLECLELRKPLTKAART